MRALIATATALAALVVTVIVAAWDTAAGARGPLVALRAGFACAIVVLAGRAAGYVLMRTALRRHYEQWRTSQAGTRPRPGR